MMNPNQRKSFALGAIALMGTSIFGSIAARADGYACRDYYSAYVDQATNPTPVVIVDARPNFHGHYPEYHDRGGDRGGFQGGGNQGDGGHSSGGKSDNSGNDVAAAIAVVAILGALSTTTAVQDAELQDASNVINDIDQAQMGDGAQLRQLQAKVQSDMPKGKTASLADVASAVNAGNQSDAFCQGGSLDSESDLAASIASSLSAK